MWRSTVIFSRVCVFDLLYLWGGGGGGGGGEGDGGPGLSAGTITFSSKSTGTWESGLQQQVFPVSWSQSTRLIFDFFVVVSTFIISCGLVFIKFNFLWTLLCESVTANVCNWNFELKNKMSALNPLAESVQVCCQVITATLTCGCDQVNGTQETLWFHTVTTAWCEWVGSQFGQFFIRRFYRTEILKTLIFRKPAQQSWSSLQSLWLTQSEVV